MNFQLRSLNLLFLLHFFSVAQKTNVAQKTIEERHIDVQKCSEYFGSFSFNEKWKSGGDEKEYIAFRPNGVLLCYRKRVLDVPIFPTSIYFYLARCKIDNQIFELDPNLFERMPTMDEFRRLRETGDPRIKGRQRMTQRPELPLGYRAFPEDSESFVLDYFNKCMASFVYITHPYNKDENLIKVFSSKGTLMCGYSLPKEFPLVHKCEPGLQDMSLNTKLFSSIPSWNEYKIVKPYLEIADYDYEHE